MIFDNCYIMDIYGIKNWRLIVLNLFSSYISKLSKNSIKLSTAHAALIGTNCIITRGYDKCLYVFSLDNWDKFISHIDVLPFNKDGRTLRRYFCANAVEAIIDDNRITLPKELQKYVGTDVIVIGMIDRLEIWNKSNYEDSYTDLEIKDGV